MKYLVGFLILVIIALTGTLAYFAGRNTKQTQPTSLTNIPDTQIDILDSLTPTPSVTPAATQIVTGGGVLSFPKYEITLPADWTFQRESQTADDEQIFLTGDGFTITITQGGFGGAVCLFPGDPDSEGPSGRYDYFEDITTQSNDQFRLVWSDGPFTGYGLCQLTQYGWGAPTAYGHISIKTNQVPTSQQLETLDSVLASFTKI